MNQYVPREGMETIQPVSSGLPCIYSSINQYVPREGMETTTIELKIATEKRV